MTETPEDSPTSRLLDGLEGLFDLSQAAMAIFLSQFVENILADKLESKLAISSNNFKNRVFAGYGPLSTFTAKIDMARALEIVDEETYNTLRILKGIRNVVAHPDTEFLPNFDGPAIVEECRKLPGYVDDANCFRLFIDTTASIIVSIDDSEDAKTLSEMLRDIPSSSVRKSSAEKSLRPHPLRHCVPCDNATVCRPPPRSSRARSQSRERQRSQCLPRYISSPWYVTR